jgi:hypothetical protein
MERREKPRLTHLAILVLVLCVPLAVIASGVQWQEFAVREFAAREGHHDLFQTWVGKAQYDYTYDYRGNNRHYELWAIRIPFFATCIALMAAAIVLHISAVRVGLAAAAGLLWPYVVLVLMWYAWNTALRWLQNSGVFI